MKATCTSLVRPMRRGGREAESSSPSALREPRAAPHPVPFPLGFFTVQTLTFKTLHVFFFITHARRRIVHFNVTAHPTAPWVWRQLLEATPWGSSPAI